MAGNAVCPPLIAAIAGAVLAFSRGDEELVELDTDSGVVEDDGCGLPS